MLHAAVTIRAAPIEREQLARAMRLARVIFFGVTLLAQPRTRNGQQLFMIRAVRFVAVQTIVARRRVLEQERAALVGMAGVTRLVDGRFLQQFFVRRAVRIVATGAGEFSFAHRHVGRAPELCFAVLVALRAGFNLGRFEQLIARGRLVHDLVAAGASKIARFVRTALPVRAHPAFMT